MCKNISDTVAERLLRQVFIFIFFLFVKVKNDHRPDFRAASFQLLKLENLLRWSFFTINLSTTAVQIWIISYILHIKLINIAYNTNNVRNF